MVQLAFGSIWHKQPLQPISELGVITATAGGYVRCWSRRPQAAAAASSSTPIPSRNTISRSITSSGSQHATYVCFLLVVHWLYVSILSPRNSP
jgi:hypothetical protein